MSPYPPHSAGQSSLDATSAPLAPREHEEASSNIVTQHTEPGPPDDSDAVPASSSSTPPAANDSSGDAGGEEAQEWTATLDPAVRRAEDAGMPPGAVPYIPVRGHPLGGSITPLCWHTPWDNTCECPLTPLLLCLLVCCTNRPPQDRLPSNQQAPGRPLQALYQPQITLQKEKKGDTVALD